MSEPPRSLRVSRDRTQLTVEFEDGAHAIAAELLRVESPSAEVQGHDPSQKVIVRGKGDVRITDVQPVGHYAVRIVFDDGHDTGIYTWGALRRFATEGEALMRRYRENSGQA